MRVVIGQSKTQYQRVGSQNPFEIRQNGDRTTFPEQNRLAVKGGFEGAQGGLRQRSGGRHEIRFTSVTAFDSDAHGRRTKPLQVPRHKVMNTLWRLVRHEAKGEFRA